MQCEYFGKCGSCKLHEKSYEDGLSEKITENKALFSELYQGEFDILASPAEHFRYRSEFRVWHLNGKISYAMNGYNKEIVLIESCSIVSDTIYSLMPRLLEALQSNVVLHERLFSIEFLATQKGDMLVTLIYHRKLEEGWVKFAKELEAKFAIKIIGRSKKQKIVLSDENVHETLQIDKEYHYEFFENGFTQPNPKVNQAMIQWVMNGVNESKDLLELYCGAGNFTLPLSTKFEKVLATEVTKVSIKSAQRNLELNGISNVEFARLSATEMGEAYDKVRPFNRLSHINLDDYNFSHIFVDPPRAGLDEVSTPLAQKFENILYISCNPITLKRDLETLTQTHEILKFAFFDQFAYTHHIESGVILSRKSS